MMGSSNGASANDLDASKLEFSISDTQSLGPKLGLLVLFVSCLAIFIGIRIPNVGIHFEFL